MAVDWRKFGAKKTCCVCGSTDDVATYSKRDYCPVHLDEERERKRKARVTRVMDSPGVTKADLDAIHERLAELDGVVTEMRAGIVERARDVTTVVLAFSSPLSVKNEFIAWLRDLDPNVYPSEAAVIRRLQQYARTSIQDQTMSLAIQFLAGRMVTIDPDNGIARVL